jgi:hypothetical protein
MPDAQTTFDSSLVTARSTFHALWNEVEAKDKTIAELTAKLAEKPAAPSVPPTGEIPLWTPQTVLEAGKTYALPAGPVAVDVKAHGVTLVGYPDRNVQPTQKPAIHVRKGTLGTVIVGVHFDADQPGTERLHIDECVRVEGQHTSIEFCHANGVDTFAKCLAGSDGTTIRNCHGTDRLRSHFVLGYGGCRNVYVIGCFATGSLRENLIRFMKQGPDFADGIYILNNPHLANDETANDKGVVDIRMGRRCYVIGNTIFATPTSSGIRFGPDDRGQEVPTADEVVEDYVAEGNTIHKGRIDVLAMARNGLIRRNRFVDMRPTDTCIDIKTAHKHYPQNMVFHLSLEENTAKVADGLGPATKPFWRFYGDADRAVNFRERDNVWEVAA